MQNLTQIHLKSKHGLMLGKKKSHFWAFTVRTLRWEKRRRREEKKRKIRRNPSMEYMFRTFVWKLYVYGLCMKISLCLSCVGKILLEVLLVGIR